MYSVVIIGGIPTYGRYGIIGGAPWPQQLPPPPLFLNSFYKL